MALLSTMILSGVFGQHRIELSLGPDGLLIDSLKIVAPGDWVVWTIKRGENIQGFRIDGVRHPFISPLSSNLSDYVMGDIKATETRRDWKYTVFYLTSTGLKRFDPKIAIRPSKVNIVNIILMVLLGAIVPLITTIFFRRKWKAAEAELKKLRSSKS